MTGIVDKYDQSTPVTATATQCDWLKISAVDIVLVSRSAQPEKPTSGQPFVTDVGQTVWTYSNTNPSYPLDLSSIPTSYIANGFTWQNYRYKTFETLVPMRNVTSVVTEAQKSGC
jgi:type IV pilus assembly protein PilW